MFALPPAVAPTGAARASAVKEGAGGGGVSNTSFPCGAAGS